MKLALFDVDGTLLSCGGAGMIAMGRAAHALYGERISFEGVSPAGAMDPMLFREALERASALELLCEHDRFRDRYLEELERALEEGRERVRALPGALGALEAVRALEDRIVLGMLTGNYGPAAHLKLRAVKLEPTWFRVTAFGDEAPTRPGLVEVALGRCEALRQRRFSGPDVLVIGDTPKDVACAAAHGCASLAVATGRYSKQELEAAGATRVVDDLSDPAPLLELLA
jgi:phosphoglycolate phosphatase